MNDETEQVQAEMPKYKCNKVVHAHKIETITFDSDVAKDEKRDTTGKAVIMPAEEGYPSFEVSAEYVQKHDPKRGGYWVFFSDGYESWSPAEAFKAGYTKIE